MENIIMDVDLVATNVLIANGSARKELSKALSEAQDLNEDQEEV